MLQFRHFRALRTFSNATDTSLAVQLQQSADLLLDDLDTLLAVLKRRAIEHKLTPTIDLGHGIHAEPVTFGLKLAQDYAEFDRNLARTEPRSGNVGPHWHHGLGGAWVCVAM